MTSSLVICVWVGVSLLAVDYISVYDLILLRGGYVWVKLCYWVVIQYNGVV